MIGIRPFVIACLVIVSLPLSAPCGRGSGASAAAETAGSKLYTNARFGFSIRYPGDWRLGEPMPEGLGITLYAPREQSQVTLSGFMNVMQGTSQDGRQTLEEFAAAHRRIITDLFEKKKTAISWTEDEPATLAGFPAKRLAFTYQAGEGRAMLEVHMFSLGRNEGRGVRIKLPVARAAELMPVITRILETYEAGRDQNAVGPLLQTPRPVPERQEDRPR